MALLSLPEMEAAIRAGGVVLVGGQLVGRVEDLPSQAQLAKGDPAKEAAAREAIDAQILALQGVRASLDRPAPAAAPADPEITTATPAEAAKPTKGK